MVTLALSLVFLVVLVGIGLLVARRRLRRGGSDMELTSFLKRLIFGRGYNEISASQLAERLQKNPPRLVDLRENLQLTKGLIPGAEPHPFDDFLREIIVEELFADEREEELVLICDHGHLSRVAASILAEDEGFTNVVNLRGGMEAWNRHQQKMARGHTCFGVKVPARCCR